MSGIAWLPLCLLLCLARETLQKGVRPRANGGLRRVLLPSGMRGPAMQPGPGGARLGAKGPGPYGIQNGYGLGYGLGNGYRRGPPPMAVPGRFGGKRKRGYGIPGNGYPAGYQNGYVNGQAGGGVGLAQGKAPGYMNGGGRIPAAAMVQPAYTNGYRIGNGFPNGYVPAYRNGLVNGGVGLQTGVGGKGVIPAGYGGTLGSQPSYVNGGVGLQTGAGGKGVFPAGYGAGGFPAAAGLPGAGTFPGVQVATSYGNGYPGLLADGGAYRAKAGKGLDAGQALYGAQPGLTNGLAVEPAAGKYGVGLPYNGQPLVPAGLGASELPYGVPEAGLRLLGDPSGIKYGNGQLQTGFLGTGPSQGMAAGAKEGKYPLNGYFGNGYGGCPPGKCIVQGKK